MRQLIKTTTLAIIIGGSVAITTPALASPATEIVTTTIDQRDLATDYGVERVYKALERKAETSCKTPGRVPITVRNFENQCAQQLLEDFVIDVDNGNLTRYHASQST